MGWTIAVATLVGVITIGGCGRIGFDPLGAGIDADGPGNSDAALDGGATFDGGATTDATFGTNVAFRSSRSVTGSIGGRPPPDSDCQLLATSVGLPGTFIALLGTQAELPNTRLVGSRGWTDVVGTPIADEPSDWLHSELLNPLWRDEHGVLSTGHDSWLGDAGIGTCQDWTSGATADAGLVSSASMPVNPDATGGGETLNISTTCNTSLSLICVGIGHSAPVAIAPVTGRIAFISDGGFTPSGGPSAADAICASEATAAGLPGTYLAALGTSTATAASRFDTSAGSAPWRRVDGAQLTATSADLFDAGVEVAETFLTTDSTGVAQENRGGWSDATTPNCLDWTSSSAGDSGEFGVTDSALHSVRAAFGMFSCNASLSVVCLQE